MVPAAELVTVVHAGSYYDFDLAYGALATHVAQHAISVDEPIREYFLVGPKTPATKRPGAPNWVASLSHHHRLNRSAFDAGFMFETSPAGTPGGKRSYARLQGRQIRPVRAWRPGLWPPSIPAIH